MPTELDYREILINNYIKHVGMEEGVTFIAGRERSEFFTPEEWEELVLFEQREEP